MEKTELFKQTYATTECPSTLLRDIVSSHCQHSLTQKQKESQQALLFRTHSPLYILLLAAFYITLSRQNSTSEFIEETVRKITCRCLKIYRIVYLFLSWLDKPRRGIFLIKRNIKVQNKCQPLAPPFHSLKPNSSFFLVFYQNPKYTF